MILHSFGWRRGVLKRRNLEEKYYPPWDENIHYFRFHIGSQHLWKEAVVEFTI